MHWAERRVPKHTGEGGIGEHAGERVCDKRERGRHAARVTDGVQMVTALDAELLSQVARDRARRRVLRHHVGPTHARRHGPSTSALGPPGTAASRAAPGPESCGRAAAAAAASANMMRRVHEPAKLSVPKAKSAWYSQRTPSRG
eukprot:scaffold40869_cov66-Phaeocystis_antarctica.AAC.3